jgi:uracil-DNA glycosylase
LHDLDEFRLLDSYHCSRYNTNTGRLTEAMFDGIFAKVRVLLDK